MADITAEIDLDSVIDRLLEGELASPKKENMFPSRLFELFLWSGIFLSFFILTSFFLYFFFIIGTMGVTGSIHVASDDAGDYAFRGVILTPLPRNFFHRVVRWSH